MTRTIVTGYFIDGPHNGERRAVQTHPGGFAPVELRFSQITFDPMKPFDVESPIVSTTTDYRYRAVKVPKAASSIIRAHYLYVFIPEEPGTPDFVTMSDE